MRPRVTYLVVGSLIVVCATLVDAAATIEARGLFAVAFEYKTFMPCNGIIVRADGKPSRSRKCGLSSRCRPNAFRRTGEMRLRSMFTGGGRSKALAGMDTLGSSTFYSLSRILLKSAISETPSARPTAG